MPASDDPLAALRESVLRAAERIQELDSDRHDLKRQIARLRGDIESLQAELSRLQARWRSDAAELRHLRALQEERSEVKERISHLLNRLDSLYLAQ